MTPDLQDPRPDDELLRWSDRPVLLLTLLTLALQGFSWWIMEGYQLADSVEYMERAQAFVRAQDVIDNQQIRSFGFSMLLVPFFFIADLLGMEDFKPLVALVRCLQMGLGVALMLICVRLGDRIGGRTSALAAGFVVAANPVFLQFTVSPLADVAAAVCVGQGALALLDPPDARAGRRAGLWLGAGLLMAYKTMPISALLVGFVLLRDRRAALPALRQFASGYLALVLLQVVLDRLVYGAWAASISSYLGENVLGIVARQLMRFGFTETGESLYRWYYPELFNAPLAPDRQLGQLQAPDWYWTHLSQFAVLPVALCAALGVLRAVLLRSWRTSVLVVIAALNVYLLSQKGSKEFRLWLPMFPMLAPITGLGAAWLLEGPVAPRTRRALCALACVATIALVTQSLLARNTRKFSGFWRAMDYVGERVEQEARLRAADDTDHGDGSRNGTEPRVACSYHWSVFLRESPEVELVKLPHQLDGWSHLSSEQRFDEVTPVMAELDWMIVHFALLTELEHSLLTHYICEWFAVEALFWDPSVFEDIGPVLVLKRKPSVAFDPNLRTMFDVVKGPSPWAPTSVLDVFAQALTLRLPGLWRGRNAWLVECLRERHGFKEPVRMIRPELREEMWFLGSTYEALDGDGHGWITYYYYVLSALKADYTFVDRLTSVDERNAWQNNHLPTYGVERTNTWRRGWVVRESWPVVATAEPYRWDQPPRPVGGPFRLGDYMPAYLWLDAATFYLGCVHCGAVLFLDPQDPHVCDGAERSAADGEVRVSGRLERARFGDDQPERLKTPGQRLDGSRGWRWSTDGLSLVDRFLLPVHPWWRMPDDGIPVDNRVENVERH